MKFYRGIKMSEEKLLKEILKELKEIHGILDDAYAHWLPERLRRK